MHRDNSPGIPHCLKVLILVSAMLASTNAFAQVRDHQAWADLKLHYRINNDWDYYGDFGYRTIIKHEIWSRVHVNPSLRYSFSDMVDFHMGVGAYYEFLDEGPDRFEVRPWQGAKIHWPSTRQISFSHYLRLEERISYYTETWPNRWEAWDPSFSLRFRYKLAGMWTIPGQGRNPMWFMPFGIEFFAPLVDRFEEYFSNKARAGFGIAFKASPNFEIDLLAHWQSSRKGPLSEFAASDFIYQLAIKTQLRSKIFNRRFRF